MSTPIHGQYKLVRPLISGLRRAVALARLPLYLLISADGLYCRVEGKPKLVDLKVVFEKGPRAGTSEDAQEEIWARRRVVESVGDGKAYGGSRWRGVR